VFFIRERKRKKKERELLTSRDRERKGRLDPRKRLHIYHSKRREETSLKGGHLPPKGSRSLLTRGEKKKKMSDKSYKKTRNPICDVEVLLLDRESLGI